ncbi:Putative NAD dependent epimerase/dehydratase family protein [Aspergillus calidoustus]|uniref:Putative NAD dependent epimerase/dehydratase family protein n=1 Tax=Aspergillus calidoustus TaxID=454130 RepID=A0A0U5CML7_ASPCI|nr:Putative NAD dependent epimerase/dehydratase family protein [Aspergillus calidoustus]
MATAIVTGATGITGGAIVRHLSKDPSYKKVYALSRHDPGYSDPKIQHATIDLQGSASDMASNLSGLSADYVYFCAYMAHEDPNELCRINGTMLSNFIQGLEKTGAVKTLKRFILTCGFKQYGVHLGNAKQPMFEDDPLLEGTFGGVEWPPNFYYVQQRILSDAAERNQGRWDWVVTLPEDVLGFAKGNFMNEATALGLYACVSKLLPGSELPFPGCKAGYFAFNTWTSSNLHARFCLWAATAPGVGNNIFNVTNGDTESWQNLWPRIAERFGCRVPEPMFPHGGTADTQGYKHYESNTVRMPSTHPLKARAGDIGVAQNPSTEETPTLFLQIDPEKWAKRKEVNEAWATLRDKYKLDQRAWEKATWDFISFVLGRDWSCVGSMSKARRFGWTGYADTWSELEDVFETLEKEGILPPAQKLKSDFK